MACLTNTSLFTSVGAVGDVCSGRGQCVLGACVCDAGWTGRADVFSLDGLACQNPEALDRTMYAVNAACMLLQFVRVMPVLSFQMRRKRTAGEAMCTGHMPVFFLLQLVLAPFMIAMWVVRAASNSENFGVTPFLSYGFALAFPMQFMLLAAINMRLFKVILLGSSGMGHSAKGLAVVRSERISMLVLTSAFSVVHAAVYIAGANLPIGNTWYRYVLTIVRNANSMVYFGFYYLHDRYIETKVREMYNSNEAQRGVDDNLSRALNHLEHSLHQSARTMKVIVPILTLFSVVPQLYSFNYVASTTLNILSNLSAHPLERFSSGAESGGGGRGTATSSSSSRAHPKDKDKDTVTAPASGVTGGNNHPASTRNNNPTTTVAAAVAPVQSEATDA